VSQGVLDIVEHKLIWDFDPIANTDRRDYSDISIPIYSEVEALLKSHGIVVSQALTTESR